MDPLSIFGVACNVIQVISYAQDLISLAYQIKEDGSVDPSLRRHTNDLSDSSSALKAYLPAISTTLTPLETKLHETARRCLECSAEIQAILQKLDTMRGGALVKAFRLRLTKKSALERLKRDMQSYKETMQNDTLIYLCDRNEAAKLEFRTDFRNFESTLQNFIRGYAQGETNLEKLLSDKFVSTQDLITAGNREVLRQTEEEHHQIRNQITETQVVLVEKSEEEHQETRRHITETNETLEARKMQESARQKLLDSLRDPEMHARRNLIETAHYKTFSWVFGENCKVTDPDVAKDSNTKYPRGSSSHIAADDNVTDAQESEDGDIVDNMSSSNSGREAASTGHRPRRKWDSFTDWLSSPSASQPYWISGKAGSGKSTFVKFLINHPRTKEHLGHWAANCVIYSHFLWTSGTQSQRSLRGLLRSLLFQVLEDYDDILGRILETPELTGIQYPDDWSRELLEATLFKFLSTHKQAVCVFIDGLDEIDQNEGPFGLIDLVKTLSNFPTLSGLKICVSSRPEASFNSKLSHYPKLKLQDLTESDLRSYVKDILRTKCSLGLHETLKDKFVSTVTQKADGVFLWVTLALKSLQRGVFNGDDPDLLMRRLEQLPPGLEDLYENMLTRPGEDITLYKEEAALAFRIVLLCTDWELDIGGLSGCSLFVLAVAWKPPIAELILNQKASPSLILPKLKEELLRTNQSLPSRCAGFLEVWYNGIPEGDFADALAVESNREPWKNFRVQFVHRSASEFLRASRQKLLDLGQTSIEDLNFRLVQAHAFETLFEINSSNVTGLWKVMYLLGDGEPKGGFTKGQENHIFTLLPDIWPKENQRFHDTAAEMGCHRFEDSLFESWPRPLQSLLDYLLICASVSRKEARIRHFLNIGADANYMSLDLCICTGELGSEDDYYSMKPVLADNLLSKFEPYIPQLSSQLLPTEQVRESFNFYLKVSLNSHRPFLLCQRFAVQFKRNTFSYTWKNTRPHNHSPIIGDECIILMIETSLIGMLVHKLKYNNPDLPLASIIGAERNLESGKSYYNIISYVVNGIAYENTIGQLPDEVWYIIEQGDGFGTMDVFKRIIKELQGKEIGDVQGWLAERGHLLVKHTDEDIKRISGQTPLEEIVDIYQRLNGRANKLWLEKRGTVDIEIKT